MSSFIVEEKTINRALFSLFQPAFSSELKHLFPQSKQEVEQSLNLGYSKEKARGIDYFTRIGRSLLALNFEATNRERYPTSPFCSIEEEKERLKAFRYEVEPCSFAQSLKSLNCLIYQCSEGRVTKTRLFKKLERLELFYLRALVYESDAYEKAEWR